VKDFCDHLAVFSVAGVGHLQLGSTGTGFSVDPCQPTLGEKAALVSTCNELRQNLCHCLDLRKFNPLISRVGLGN
jgi:hypothetical protein